MHFPTAIYRMKSLNSVMALLVGAALLTAGAGCKHGPKTVTMIPGSRSAVVSNGETPSGPIKLPDGGRNAINGLPGPTEGTTGNTGLKDNPGGTGTDIGRKDLTPEVQKDRPDPGAFNEDPTALQAETVYFELDRSSVKASEMPKLERIAAFLKTEGTAKLRVEGNCDERGTEEYNRSLGERRALAAREVLVNLGVSPDRITTTTYGEDKPSDPGHDDAAWAKNRRDDFVVLRPKTGTGLQ
jgi:peptidoglycan-associated lipoprotein